MGIDWPASPLLLLLIACFLVLALWLQGKALFRSTLPRLAWKLVGLRVLTTCLLLLLLVRPFLSTEEPDVSRMKLLALSDLSGSMDAKDEKQGPRRISEVAPFFAVDREGAWINQMRSHYGKVDRFGFSNEVSRLSRNSWQVPELGKKTALGDALHSGLSQEVEDFELGSVVVFSDGVNNQGRDMLAVAKEYRARGIPINVIGVGKELLRGDIGVSFADRNPRAVAKEELLFQAEVINKFPGRKKARVSLEKGDQVVEEITVDLEGGESKVLSFAPLFPKFAGSQRYRLVVVTPEGDSDPSNDSDSLLVVINPPEQFSVLYLSNQVRPLYPFLKRTLGNEERFNLSSIVRLGENVFHAFGEKVKPDYPQDPNDWMEFNTVLLDLECLAELNASVVSSLKDFVQKRGGGLLAFGELGEARKQLGGLLPAKSTERVLAKDNLSLRVYEQPLFTPKDRVEKMKPFMPDRLPGYFVTTQNKGARGVVVSKANGKAVLSVQAYGAGKSAYWGVPDDWRRAIGNESGAKEFRKFWQTVTQWLGEGGEDRLKIDEREDVLPRGIDATLKVEALGADFEPAMDAMVKAEVMGPDGFSKTIQLYPQGATAGQYSGSFRPKLPGAYAVKYNLLFPDGEELNSESFIRVSETGEESKDLSYAERELKMLAKLTGGQFLSIQKMNDNWVPTFAESIPTLQKRASLSDLWPFFIMLFLAAGFEWVLRRQVGLR
ncbi:MAG: hypothetical protein P8N49_03890 [Opitutales bacterium]|nr:hypothetical protein [Opitutales bacterium]